MGLMDHSVKVIADGFVVFVGRHRVQSQIANEVVYWGGLWNAFAVCLCGYYIELNVCNLWREIQK